MNASDERNWILSAVHRAAQRTGIDWPPPGAAPLRDMIAAFNLVHDEVPALTYVQVAKYLDRAGIEPPSEYWLKNIPLAGFVFANANGGYILVQSDDPVPRRRFSAAHELGHFLLHFSANPEDDGAGFVQDDATLNESDDEKLAAQERQANRFAAELLMPEATCRTIVAETLEKSSKSSRYLEHRLAGAFLVSRAAAQWRLRSLGLA